MARQEPQQKYPWDRDNHELKLINRTGNFTPGETITGAESGTVQDSVTVDNLTLENVQYADNKYIETTGNDLLDFTEVNPWRVWQRYW